MDPVNTGIELGSAAFALWSRYEASKAKKGAEDAKRETVAVRAAVQPNGETLASILREIRKGNENLISLAQSNNRFLRALLRFERYTHRRNHTIIDGLFAVRLGNVTILRKMGMDIPDPPPPVPDALSHPDGDSIILSVTEEADRLEREDSLRSPSPSSEPTDSSA